jgi:transcriptional regulator GlxA family with amidase domain
MNIAIVLFPHVEELDFVGPLEVFGMAAKVLYKDWRVFTVAEEPVVKGVNGLSVNVTYTFADAPHADIIIVPGGFGTRAGMENEALVGYIQRAGGDAEWVTSVCTGAFLLHRAGFLKGRRATTYWAERKTLAGMGDVDVVEERWVHDGNVITAAGVSAGIDMALYLVGVLKGPEEARKLQKLIEYDPAPPYAEAPAPATA